MNERLSAAVEEIFGVFKNFIVEYEVEMDRQRKLPRDNLSKPHVELHRTGKRLTHLSTRKRTFLTGRRCVKNVLSLFCLHVFVISVPTVSVVQLV